MDFARFKRMSRDDFPKAPDWFLSFLDSINPIIDVLNLLLKGQIDTTFNLLCERQTISLQSGVSTTVKMQKLTATPPFFMRVGFANGFLVSSAGITAFNPDGTIQVTVNLIGTGTASVPCLLIFEP